MNSSVAGLMTQFELPIWGKWDPVEKLDLVVPGGVIPKCEKQISQEENTRLCFWNEGSFLLPSPPTSSTSCLPSFRPISLFLWLLLPVFFSSPSTSSRTSFFSLTLDSFLSFLIHYVSEHTKVSHYFFV